MPVNTPTGGYENLEYLSRYLKRLKSTGRIPGPNSKRAVEAGRAARVARQARTASRAAGAAGTAARASRLARGARGGLYGTLAVTAGEAAIEGYQAAKSQAELTQHEGGLTKKGYRVERPRMGLRDFAKMMFVPNYNAPSSDVNQIEIYTPSGKKIGNTRRSNR